MISSKYFTESEFACPCCGKIFISDVLVLMLDEAREISGVTFVIASGYRCEYHNASKDVGGKPNSAHLSGLAVDIACDNSHSRWLMLEALFDVGFKRIEISDKHLHVDIDKTKPQEVAFLNDKLIVKKEAA